MILRLCPNLQRLRIVVSYTLFSGVAGLFSRDISSLQGKSNSLAIDSKLVHSISVNDLALRVWEKEG